MRECDLEMAREGITVVVISSSSSSSSSSEEDEEAAYERSQKLKLRETYRLFDCRGRTSGGEDDDDDDDDDDCVILEKDPFAEEDAKTIADLSSKLSLSSGGGGGGGEGGKDGPLQPQTQHQEDEGEEENEVSILAERGKVALRDYPHSRHLCAKLPFGKTPHESHCNECYCYVCDKPAPCEQWKGNSQGHCNATDQDDEWRKLRKANRSHASSQEVGA